MNSFEIIRSKVQPGGPMTSDSRRPSRTDLQILTEADAVGNVTADVISIESFFSIYSF